MRPARAPQALRKTHVFVDAGVLDVLGRDGIVGTCCTQPRRHPVHNVPDRSEAMTESRRRAGERDTDTEGEPHGPQSGQHHRAA